MIKIFGSTRYVKTDVSDSTLIGNTPDVEPFEMYLQPRVKNMWDWNTEGYHLEYKDGFSFYVALCAKENNETYHFYKLLKKEGITEEYQQAIDTYFKK